MIEGTVAEGDDERAPMQPAPGKPVPHVALGTDARPRAKLSTTFTVVALPAALVVAYVVACRVMGAPHPAPSPPPVLRARFDALLETACPDIRLPPPVFCRTTLYARRPGRRDEPVWIADAHAENAWGVRIVLSANTGAVRQFSSEVWAAHPPERTSPPQIQTAAEARSAARRFLLWLRKPAIEEGSLRVTNPGVMLPRPWGIWLVSAHRGDRRWMMALDAQTGNLLDFREDVTTSRANP